VPTTVTETLPEPLPELAVTLIVVPTAALPAAIVAVAWPLTSVVEDAAVRVPALVVKAIDAPLTTTLFASLAVAVIVAVVVPSAEIWVALEVTATCVTVLVPPLLLPELDEEPPVKDEPPQPASSATHAQVMIDNLRMSKFLAKPVVLYGINRDSIPHAKSWA
jgi:hypothetical protein